VTKVMGRAAVPGAAPPLLSDSAAGLSLASASADDSKQNDAERVEAVRALSEAAYENKVSLSVQRQKLSRAEREP